MRRHLTSLRALAWKVGFPIFRISLGVVAGCLLLLIVSGWHRILWVPSPERAFAGSVAPGTFEVRGGLPVLVLEGTPEEIGRRHGERLGGQIRESLRPFLEQHYEDRLDEALAFARRLDPDVPEDLRVEMRALARAAGVAYDDLLLANCTADLAAAGFLCSVLVAAGEATGGGPLVIGRNLDFPGYGILDGYSLLFVYRPHGKRAFAAVGFPGLVGVLTGMNEKGVCVADLVALGIPAGERGLPHILHQRRILEESDTAADPVQAAARGEFAAGQTVVVADPTDAFALELSPRSFGRRGLERGVLLATNTFGGGGCPRFARLAELAALAHGRLTVDAVRAALTATSLDWMNLHAIVLVPADRTLYLARGRTLARASDAPYVRVALAAAFAPGAGPRAVAVEPVPAVAEPPRRFDEPKPPE